MRFEETGIVPMEIKRKILGALGVELEELESFFSEG
jgi:hypothetical protein